MKARTLLTELGLILTVQMYACLVPALVCSETALPTESQDVSVRFATQGAPSLSMASYGLVTKEIGPPRTEQHSVQRANFEEIVRGKVAEINAQKSPPLTDDSIRTYVQASTEQVATYNQRVRQIEDTRYGAGALAVVGAAGIGVLGLASVVPGGFAAVGATLVGLSALHTDGKLQRQVSRLEKEHSQKMNDALTVALAKDPQLLNSLKKLADNPNDKLAQEALDDAIVKAPAIKTFLDKFPQGPSRDYASEKMGTILPAAVARAHNMSKKETNRLDSQSSKNSKRLVDIGNAFGEFRENTREDFSKVENALKLQNDSLKALQGDLASLTKKVEASGKDVKTISEDLSTMKDLMWGNLSDRDKLYAFDHGFMRNLSKEEREQTRIKLQQAAEAGELLSKIDVGVTYVRGAAKLAKVMGGDINTEQLEKNIATAQTIGTVVANLMTPNYFGALMAMGGLFGESGPDAGEIRHQQVMAKLDAIIKLQMATLQAIDDLSLQIARSTQAIMGKLVELEIKQDLTNTLITEDFHKAPQDACVEFQTRAYKDFEMHPSGQFSSYENRRAHFAKHRVDFKRCTNYLNDGVARLNTNDSTPHPALRVDLVDFKNAKSWQATHWEPMLRFTHDLLGTSNKPFCSSRLLGLASRTPVVFGDISYDQLHCDTEDIANSTPGVYFSYDGRAVPGTQALNNYLYFPMVRFMGELLAFYAPYYELQARDTAALLPLNEILNAGPPSTATKGETWMGQYLDIANVALAQEAVTSGVFLVKDIAEKILQKSQFGEVELEAGKPFDYWRGCWQKLEKNLLQDEKAPCKTTAEELRKAWLEDPANARFIGPSGKTMCSNVFSGVQGQYFALACLMDTNPIFSDNVVAYLVLRALEESRKLNQVEGKFTQGTEIIYRVAYYYKDPSWIQKALPGLPLEWRTIDQDNEGWHLKLRRHTGEPWYVPLPRPYIIGTGTIVYSPTMQQAQDYRDRLMQRYLFHSMHRHIGADTKLPKEAKLKTLKLMQQIALYSQDTVLAQTFVPPPVPRNQSQMTEASAPRRVTVKQPTTVAP